MRVRPRFSLAIRVSEGRPKASVFPEPLFRRGVTVMGGVRITDSSRMIHLIGEAGSGYDFFENCAEKVIMRNETIPVS